MLRVRKSVLKDDQGLAAVEFALIFPICLVLFMGVVEICNFSLQSRRADMAVNLAAELISRDTDGLLQISERRTIEDVWMIVNPTAYHDVAGPDGEWANGYSREFASVKFISDKNCSINCSYRPITIWTFLSKDALKNSVSIQCALTVVKNDSDANGSQLRVGTTGRSPIVIADFTYPYEPIFYGFLFHDIELRVSAVRRIRNGLPLDHAPDPLVKRC